MSTQKMKEKTISVISLYENYDFQNELEVFLKQKGYEATLDLSETESIENGTPRLIMYVRKLD